MRNCLTGLIFVVVGVLAISSAILAQSGRQTATPSAQSATSGHPDLSGVWAADRTKWVFPKEAPAMTPQTEETYLYNRHPNRDAVRPELSPAVNCMPPGPTWLLMETRNGNSFIEILQSPKRVLMMFEFDHWNRQIWTDGRDHPKPLELSWLGHSIGKWDGDTLIVDTVGIHDQTWLDNMGHPHSDALHIVERIRRPDHDSLVDDLTFEDPKMYTKPWGGHLTFKLKPDGELEERVNCEDRWLFKTRSY